MTISDHFQPRELLLLVAGAKGAIGSSLAAAAEALRKDPGSVRPRLTSGDLFTGILPLDGVRIAGWDPCDTSLNQCLIRYRILPESVGKSYGEALAQVPIHCPDPSCEAIGDQVDRILADIEGFRARWPDSPRLEPVSFPIPEPAGR